MNEKEKNVDNKSTVKKTVELFHNLISWKGLKAPYTET